MSGLTYPKRPVRSAPDAAPARKVLRAVDGLELHPRAAAVGLHWAMASLRCDWAAFHQFGEGRMPELIVATPSVDKSEGALLDFVSPEMTDAIAALARKAAAVGRPVVVGGTRASANSVSVGAALARRMT